MDGDYLILHIISTFIVLCIFIYLYYKFVSKEIEPLDKNNLIKKESILVFFKYLSPVLFLVWLILIIATNYVYLSSSRMSFGLIILFFILSILLFLFLIIPIYTSLYYLNKSDLKSYFKQFLIHSSTIGIFTAFLINISSFVFLSVYCKFNYCQSESVLLIAATEFYSFIFLISYLVFSVFISLILLLVKKGYAKYIFIFLSLILIISASYNIYINMPMSYYLQKAINSKDISYCDNMLQNPRRSVNYYIAECKKQFIILNKLGQGYCNQYISDPQERGLCVFEYALMNNDPKICDDIFIYDWNIESSKNYCEFIFNMKSSNECELFDSIKDTKTYYHPHTGMVKKELCVTDYAMLMKKSELCNDIVNNQDDKDYCYGKMAYFLNDKNICDSISKGNFRNYYKMILDCKEKIVKVENK